MYYYFNHGTYRLPFDDSRTPVYSSYQIRSKWSSLTTTGDGVWLQRGVDWSLLENYRLVLATLPVEQHFRIYMVVAHVCADFYCLPRQNCNFIKCSS